MPITLLIAVSATAAPARRNAPVQCRPGHSRLLAVDTQAQVYKVIDHDGLLEAFGCAYGSRPYFLGPLPEGSLSPNSAEIGLITLSGSTVAYQYSKSGEVGGTRWIIAVRNLRTGRWQHRVPTGKLEEPNSNPGSAGIGPATTIVVKSDGSVAWIAEDVGLSPENGPTYYQVHAVDKTGSRVLAAGIGIDPHSLALIGSTLYWIQSGKPGSTSLN